MIVFAAFCEVYFSRPMLTFYDFLRTLKFITEWSGQLWRDKGHYCTSSMGTEL